MTGSLCEHGQPATSPSHWNDPGSKFADRSCRKRLTFVRMIPILLSLTLALTIRKPDPSSSRLSGPDTAVAGTAAVCIHLAVALSSQ